MLTIENADNSKMLIDMTIGKCRGKSNLPQESRFRKSNLPQESRFRIWQPIQLDQRKTFMNDKDL